MPGNVNSPSDQIRLLLVDDERGFVEVLSKRLARRNLSVTNAFSGTEAIQALRNGHFDLAILDLKMDDMDGLEVLRVFKKMDPEMPVIMLSGHSSDQTAQEGMSMGAFDYLTKPYELGDLLEKIREAVRRAE